MENYIKIENIEEDGPFAYFFISINRTGHLFLSRLGQFKSGSIFFHASRDFEVVEGEHDCHSLRLYLTPRSEPTRIERKKLDYLLLAIHEFNFRTENRASIPVTIEEEYFMRINGARPPMDPLLELAR